MRSHRFSSHLGGSPFRLAHKVDVDVDAERTLRVLNESSPETGGNQTSTGWQNAKRWCMAISTRRIGTDAAENSIDGWRLTR